MLTGTASFRYHWHRTPLDLPKRSITTGWRG